MECVPRWLAWERANTYALRFRRRISTLITWFGLAARCRGLQSPTWANPRRYKVSMVSLTPLGEPTTVNTPLPVPILLLSRHLDASDLLSSGTNSCDIIMFSWFWVF